MILLLDTHVFLWFVWDDPQLSTNAKSLIIDPTNRKMVSVASCWEIAIKVGTGKLSLGEPAGTYIPRQLSTNRFDILAIAIPHVTSVESLPFHHKDPFDRLLAAQVLIEQISIVSADAIFDLYGVPRLW